MKVYELMAQLSQQDPNAEVILLDNRKFWTFTGDDEGGGDKGIINEFVITDLAEDSVSPTIAILFINDDYLENGGINPDSDIIATWERTKKKNR